MRFRTIAACVPIISAIGGGAFAQEGKQDFRLVNKTGYEIKEVYVSPSRSADWEEDILADGVLGDLEARDIHFHRSATGCQWDLKVVYSEDSSSAIWAGIDLCSVRKIVIHYDKDADKTSADFD
jgi:hypothetical protein